MERPHPLDKLIRDDSLCLLETLVPFIDFPYKRLFIIFIKYKELTSIMNCLEDRNYISNCGFDCHPKTTEDIIENVCSHMPLELASKLRQMKQMLNAMELMNNMTSGNNDFENSSPSQKCAFTSSDNFAKDLLLNSFGNKNNINNNLFSSVMDILNDSNISEGNKND